MKTLVVGDLHGDWGSLNTLINHKNPEYIIQVGDFGWWPHFHGKKGLLRGGKKFDQFGIKNHDTKIFWLPGNHCNWDDLNCISVDEPYEMQTGVTYCPFGTVIEINGISILMVGGAASTDAAWRTEGIDWWRSEVITQAEMDNLPDCKIDVVMSHTIPRNFFEYATWRRFSNRMEDSSTLALQLIYERYRPTRWYSGHFHHYSKVQVGDCIWTSLGCPGFHNKWWEEF